MLNEYILGNMNAGVRAPGRACVRACLRACAAMRACAGVHFIEKRYGISLQAFLIPLHSLFHQQMISELTPALGENL